MPRKDNQYLYGVLKKIETSFFGLRSLVNCVFMRNNKKFNYHLFWTWHMKKNVKKYFKENIIAMIFDDPVVANT